MFQPAINNPSAPCTRSTRQLPRLAMMAAVLAACAGGVSAVPILYSGSQHTAIGSATITPSSDGRRLAVHNLGSSGNDGVEISLRSAFGGGVTYNSTDIPNAPGAMCRTKYKGWDGTIKGVRTTTAQAGGTMRHMLDYTGAGAVSVTVVVIDGTGHELSNTTFLGPVATVEMAPPPCPPGSQWGWAKWYDFWYGGTHYLGNFCNDPIHPIWRVVVTPHFAPGTNPDLRLDSMRVEASGMAELNLSDPSFAARESSAVSISEIVVSKPTITGKGQAQLHEQCDDGTDCTNPALRKLVASNIGSSGQDGVEVKWRTPTAATSGSFSCDELFQGTGQIDASVRYMLGLRGSALHISGGVAGSVGSAQVFPDFSSLGSTEYLVTGYDSAGVAVYQSVRPHGTGVIITPSPVDQIICYPNAIVWGWVTEWQYYQPAPYSGGHYITYWGVAGCGGTGIGIDNTPNSPLRIVFSPVNPVRNDAALDGYVSASITGRDVGGPIRIQGVSSLAQATACPAAGMVENFDTMNAGPVVAYPCWSNWDGLTNISGTVTAGTGTGGSNSLRIDGTLNSDGQGDNVVRAVTIDGGRSTFTTNIRVPSGITGTGFIALMDQYSAAALHLGAWLVVDGNNNTVRNVVNNLHRAALVRDQWVPLRVEVDMDADTVAAYYNNQLLFSGQSWRTGTGFPGSAPVGLNRIVGLALYSGDTGEPGLSAMYFDDMSLLKITAPACQADANGDGVVDGADFIAFINSFAAGDVAVDPIADINGDTIIDGDDFIGFINAFSAGC